MIYPKPLLIGAAVVIIGLTGGVTAMELENQDIQKADIPITMSDKHDVTPTPISGSVALEETTTSSASVGSAATESLPTESSAAPIVNVVPTPQQLFSANSSQYPGSGEFQFDWFYPTSDWIMTFNYTCDSGVVFAVFDSHAIYKENGTYGPFSNRAEKIKVVVPENQNCTWSVSVS